MNLPALIDRLRRCCPGWEPPSELAVVPPDGPGWHSYTDGTSDKTAMPPNHAAAIILASVKEWWASRGLSTHAEFLSFGGIWRVRLSDFYIADAPTELEAFAAALEERGIARDRARSRRD